MSADSEGPIEYQEPRYIPSLLDHVEYLENYCADGLHPVQLGDVFADGRYRVLHKLGYGGDSTVWLARDLNGSSSAPSLVSLKIIAADMSNGPLCKIPDFYVPQELSQIAQTVSHPARHRFLTHLDHFMHVGPNGTHLCIVSDFEGPSLAGVSTFRGHLTGPRRLRAQLARRLAGQVVETVDFLHSSGVVHGDLTASNFLFRLTDVAPQWSDDEVYAVLGTCRRGKVIAEDGSPVEPRAPPYVVDTYDNSRLCSSTYLHEEVVLIDFGQAFFVNNKPPDYHPATQIHYLAPEMHFEDKVGFASDIWALACLLFQIRAGYGLFDAFFRDTDFTFKRVVQIFGKFPEPWWLSWEARSSWFDQDGEPKVDEDAGEQKRPTITTKKISLRTILRDIGKGETPPKRYVGPGTIFENAGTMMDEEEVELFADLLEKMLRYKPEERITIEEVSEHPWFKYQ